MTIEEYKAKDKALYQWMSQLDFNRESEGEENECNELLH